METKKVLNIAAFALAVISLFLKANHFMGANIALVLSAVLMLVSLFMFALNDNKESGLTPGLNYFLIGTMALFIIGVIFKFMHWPGSGIFVVMGYTLAFILPLILIAQKNDFKISRQFIIIFFTYFILVIGLFPNNPIHKFLGSAADYISSAKEVPAMDLSASNTMTP